MENPSTPSTRVPTLARISPLSLDTPLCVSLRKYEELRPIIIDIEIDGIRVVDLFMWNLHETSETPESFAWRSVVDMKLPHQFFRRISRSIRSQVAAYAASIPPLVRGGGCGVSPAPKDDSGLYMLKINVQLGSMAYNDCVEWDIHCLDNSPEVFARQTVADLRLPQEFEFAIAQNIYLQVFNLRQATAREIGLSAASVSGFENNEDGRYCSNTSNLSHPFNRTNGANGAEESINISVGLDDRIINSSNSSASSKAWRMSPVGPNDILRSEMQLDLFSNHVHLLTPREQIDIKREMWMKYCPSTVEKNARR